MHSEARRAYALNHSDLRALTRYDSDRPAKLKQVCRDRWWWKGDSWSLPATPGAIAALKTLEGRQTDLEVLSLHGIVAAKAEGQLPTSASIVVHRAVLTALRLRPAPVLP